MNTLICFGLFVTVTVAYGASLPDVNVAPAAIEVPEAVLEELEPQESRGYGHHHGGGGWGHGGGHYGHGGHHYGHHGGHYGGHYGGHHGGGYWG